MKNKKCPNCLCDIDSDARICPFCKTAIKGQMKLLSGLGFKPPEVVAQDIKPLHNTKVTTQLPQLSKKDETIDDDINYIEVSEQEEKTPYTPKILNIKDLPQNNDLFIETEEETEHIKTNSEFDFNGELMQEIKSYFEMPSPNSNSYEQKHLEIIDNMSIDDIINGSLDTHKKEKQQESFGVMFGEEQEEDLPEYQDISQNTLESSEKVKKIYDKIVEKKDYNSYMYDTLDTSLDALGFVDEKVDFGDLKKKLAEPEPTLQSISSNIVENIPFKIPKLPIKKELEQEEDNSDNVIINDFETPSFINNINSIEEFKQNVEENELNTLFDLLQIRGRLISEEIDKEDPFYRHPFEIDNIEIAEVKDYFKEEKEEEIVKASEINVNADFLKELNDFAGVKEDVQIEELIPEENINTIVEKTIPKFQSKNVLRVSDENIEEKSGEMLPTRIIRDAISELEALKFEFPENKEESIEVIDEISQDNKINTDLSTWFDNNKEKDDENIEPNEINIKDDINEQFFNLSDLNNIQLEFDESKKEDKQEEYNDTLEPLSVKNHQDELLDTEEIHLPSFINQDIEVLELDTIVQNFSLGSDLEIEIPNNIINLIGNENNVEENINNIQKNDLLEQNIDNGIKNEENLDLIQIPQNILELTESFTTDEVIEQEKNIVEILKIDDIQDEFIEQKDTLEYDSNVFEPVIEEKLISVENPDEIKIPDFLNNISIEEPKLDDIIDDSVIEKEDLPKDINNVVLNRLKMIKNTNDETENVKIPEITNFVKPPPPPPVVIQPPPPPPPTFIEEKQSFSIPKFDDSNEAPKMRSPITTTLNTTLGARGTTNTDAMNHYIFARDLCLKKEYHEALEELEKAVKIDPAFEQAHILLSRTYLKVKNVY